MCEKEGLLKMVVFEGSIHIDTLGNLEIKLYKRLLYHIQKYKKITNSTTIEIEFDYPLEQPITLEFIKDGGFRLKDIISSVRSGYRKIYKVYPDSIACHAIGDLVLVKISEWGVDSFTIDVDS